jgi:hypothetical protein
VILHSLAPASAGPAMHTPREQERGPLSFSFQKETFSLS